MFLQTILGCYTCLQGAHRAYNNTAIMQFTAFMFFVLGHASQLAKHGANLTQNLRVGVGLALFQRTAANSLVASLDQLAILIVFDVSAAVLFGFVRTGGEGDFNPWIFAALSANVLCLFLAGLVVGRISKQDDVPLRLPVLLATLYLPFEMVGSIHTALVHHAWSDHHKEVFAVLPSVGGLWAASVVIWVLASICNLRSARLLLSCGVLFIAIFLPQQYFPLNSLGWQSEYAEQEDTARSLEWVTKESTFYAQAAMLPAHLSAIQRGTPNKTDLYFIGMAPDASQDVFIKEIRSVSKLFVDRFGAEGKSISLVNHRDAWQVIPIASMTSLKASLGAVSVAMNREEDVLFLYITTHGSRSHELSVQLSPLQLETITPGGLRSLLEESGIKWKIIVISACYAGGFIGPLTEDHTLIMTAADATHTSFGCGNQYDYTYFGEALFKDQLPHTYSFVDAFEKARRTIEAREISEKLTPSNPQMFVSPAMRAKLKRFEQELQARDTRLASAKRGASSSESRSGTH